MSETQQVDDTESTFKNFLENCHPSLMVEVDDLWKNVRDSSGITITIIPPDIKLHCPNCKGARTFRSSHSGHAFYSGNKSSFVFTYKCGDCHKETKNYYLFAALGETEGLGEVYKYGELPPFGIPVPSKTLRIFGDDAKLFLKGRQCENQGLGVAAFAYYRRVVENNKNAIYDEIIGACKTLGNYEALTKELEKAKQEISFEKSLELIKSALPNGIMIRGQNPLKVLHTALSIGIHVESDEQCLIIASSIRILLTETVENISMIRKDKKNIEEALSHIMKKSSLPKTTS